LLCWVKMLKFCGPYLPHTLNDLSCARERPDVEEVNNGICVRIGMGPVATNESSGFPVQSTNWFVDAISTRPRRRYSMQ